MTIEDVLCVPALSGFYLDDQAAIGAGAAHDGFLYEGRPLTPGFRAIREPGTAVSVLLILADGQVAVGDCAQVQYGGAGGRSEVFDPEQVSQEIQRLVAPLLLGRSVDSFRSLAEEIDRHVTDGQALGTAVRYGVTQALLHATALVRRLTMAEVICEEYDTASEIKRVPVYAQSGDDRHLNVDKMILKEVEVLPHGLINNVDTKLGRDGSLLREYIGWVRQRILAHRAGSHYQPRLHFDVYGTIGAAFELDVDRIAEYLGSLAREAEPFRLSIEHPVDAGGRQAQIELYARLRAELARRGTDMDLVVDEWCNTLADIEEFVAAGAADAVHVKTPDLGGINNAIAALLFLRRSGVGAFCGGTSNETDVSARVTAHIAMACGADQLLAKPGMGVDEGVMIVRNEMDRTVALVQHRRRRRSDLKKKEHHVQP